MESNLNHVSVQNLEEIIKCTIQMNRPNDPIEIFTGNFSLLKDDIYCKINGKIEFKWFPHPHVKFSGEAIDYNFTPFQEVRHKNPFQLKVSELTFGIAQVTNFSFTENEKKISGVLTQDAMLGDSSINVDKIRFSIPNLIGMNGLPIKGIKEQNTSISNSRLILDNNDYVIKLDKIFDYKIFKDKLIDEGGYLVLYGGEITATKGYINYKDAQALLFMFSNFLTFLNGRRTSVFFCEGIYNNDVKWKDFQAYKLDIYNYSPSWLSPFSINGINELWQHYSKLWLGGHDSFLRTVIHWYIEANKKTAALEGAIVIAQTAIELLYNWYIVETKKIIVGKDSENINAANKIRLLISQLNINSEVPSGFLDLKNYISSRNIIDAPEAIVQIRNAIVHSQEEKRRKIMETTTAVKFQALELTIWYIEICILKILNFNGTYINRCSNEKFRKEEALPWNINR